MLEILIIRKGPDRIIKLEQTIAGIKSQNSADHSWAGEQEKELPFFGMRQEKYISGGPEALFATACP